MSTQALFLDQMGSDLLFSSKTKQNWKKLRRIWPREMNISFFTNERHSHRKTRVRKKKKERENGTMSSGKWTYISEPETLQVNRQMLRVWPANCHGLWTSHGIKIWKNPIRKGSCTESVDKSPIVGNIVKWESPSCIVKENTNTTGRDHQRQGQDTGLACERTLLKSIIHRLFPQPYNPEAIFWLIMWIILNPPAK